MTQKNALVRTGDFLFKWRNVLFPVMILALFLPFHPPGAYWGRSWLEEAKDYVALALILGGLAFRALTIGWAYIKRGGLNKQVYADKLVRDGLFGVCRNPLYVGNILIYTGVFILHGHPVVILAGTLLYVLIYVAIVAAEEYFLRGKFGEEYETYAREVSRWLPDFSKYKSSIRGMNFSFRRALFKDYTTIFNTLLVVAIIETIEHITYRPADYEGMMIVSLSLFCVATLILLSVGYVKKTSNVKT